MFKAAGQAGYWWEMSFSAPFLRAMARGQKGFGRLWKEGGQSCAVGDVDQVSPVPLKLTFMPAMFVPSFQKMSPLFFTVAL